MSKSTQIQKCLNCGKKIEGQVKFCPECGSSFCDNVNRAIMNTDYDIPKDGIAIEFMESSSGGFSSALDIIKTAPINLTCLRSNKTWYLASWPINRINDTEKLVQCLKGMRNRKVYINGSESKWDEIFGYIWCAEKRSLAFKPIEYCFGLDDKRFNIWGCKQSQMEWIEWSQWFSYGSFKKTGILKNQIVFEFDKNRIKHELQTNLFKFRFCPYMNQKFIEAIIDSFPTEVYPEERGDWVFKKDYNETPGAIKIKTNKNESNMFFGDEYYAVGVIPKSLSIAMEIIKSAIKKFNLSSENISNILEYKE